MRVFLTLLMILVNSALGLTQEAEFSLKERTFKFPKTKEGIVLEHVYKFTNTGNEPLIIDEYAVACHCTTAELPSEPILPGATGEVKVFFDTDGKYGQQDRFVYLYTNTKRKKEKLRFKVYVIPVEE